MHKPVETLFYELLFFASLQERAYQTFMVGRRPGSLQALIVMFLGRVSFSGTSRFFSVCWLLSPCIKCCQLILCQILGSIYIGVNRFSHATTEEDFC